MRPIFIQFILFLFLALFTTTSLQAQEQSFQEESLFYAGKVWGFVKYYHPEARLGKFDIDSSLVVLLDKVSETKNLKERNTVLNQWVANFGKITEFEKFVVKDSSQYKLFYDYSWLENQTFDKKLSKQLIDIKNAKRTDSCYYVNFLYQFIIPSFDNEKPINPDFTKQYQKMLPLFRYWNVIEYYFPYKYLIDKKWDDVLKEYIPLFLKGASEYDINTAIQFLIINIKDGHSYFNNNNNILMEYPFKKYFSPIELIYSKDRFIVKGLLSYYKTTENISDYGLEVGDEIVSVDNRDPNEIIKNDYAKYIRASNFEYLCGRINVLLLQSDTTFINVSHKRNGEIFNSRLELANFEYKKTQPSIKEKLEITKDSIAYLNVEEISPEEIYKILYKIQKTKGIVLDMRGYPDHYVCMSLASSLSPYRRKFFIASGSVKNTPGLFKIADDKYEQTFLGYSNRYYYPKKIIIIVNSSTISSAEFSTMLFQQLPNTITIGSRTAGADGNAVFIPLTDKIAVFFSSVGIYYPDGGETQRVGVRIDEMVYPTPKGIKEGRDELVERAIEIIRSK